TSAAGPPPPADLTHKSVSGQCRPRTGRSLRGYIRCIMTEPAEAVKDGGAGNVLAIAEAYLQAGLCVLPIRRDWTKAPTLEEWKWLEGQLPTPRHLAAWFGVGQPPGIGVICGAVSGNLETLDFDRDAGDVFPRWCALVDEERPGLVS